MREDKVPSICLTLFINRRLRWWNVVVIGTGIMGACVARELSRYNLNVVVLDKENARIFSFRDENDDGVRIHLDTISRWWEAMIRAIWILSYMDI